MIFSQRNISSIVLLLIVTQVLSCKSQTRERIIYETVKKHVQSFLKDKRFNAVSIAVYSKGASHINHFGELDKGKGNTPTNETLYEIASVTKTMTGYLVAKAVKRGKIKLSDPITKHLGDEYNNLTFDGIPITIKHLLTHTSGLPSNVKGIPELYTDATKNSYGKAQYLLTSYRKDSLLSDLKRLKIDRLPGREYTYSNVAPNLLAYILEVVYDVPFNILLEKHLFEPAKMKNTFINLPQEKRALLANGYNDSEELMPNFKQPIQLWGAAGRIKSNSIDLLNYIKFQLNTKNPVVKESHRKLYKDTNSIWIGYFWEIMDDEDGLHIEHHGGIYGSQNWLIIYPKYDFGISFIVNSSFPEVNQLIKKITLNIFKDLK
ncbi:CubicO group peptidase, beta-lactamase class C family [Marivirga sericea]|uniref:CubicO group peptidase, beta-lactamase class C family n=1 Tax=Marivirga sericea TaxID=1028 RepID=A0A1X7JLN1_9BACT|nr:serine hydrolase domain-containing protein [Marivirga sericea]SMG29090.1 CubicO group peptidase, beta-lactamase class C family [Marivirga sericea]